jgi:hypothetical protein
MHSAKGIDQQGKLRGKGFKDDKVLELHSFASHPNPTRERGTDLRRFRDVYDQSLAHASGYE